MSPYDPARHGPQRIVGPGFHEQVFALVRQVPAGAVTTYGDVGAALGSKNVARHVGYATSSDGMTWTKHPTNPVLLNEGAIDVTRVGDRYVMEEMKARGYNFGGEQSGHFIFRDLNTTGDGIISAVQLLRIIRLTGKPLSELRTVMSKS